MVEREDDGKRGPHNPVRFHTSFHNTIYDAMKVRGWRESDPDSPEGWDIHWTDRDMMFEVFDTTHLESWQRVNHFRNCRELCRKDLLVKNLKRQKRQLAKAGRVEEAQSYNFWPTSYVLPGDYALFAEEFKCKPNATWIMKPIARSQGKGIFIFQKLSQISRWKSDNRYKPDREDAESYVVQRYINSPYLVGGRKFDIRLYALVTSFNPLTVWIYRGGFCRFTTYRYSNASSDITNNYMHLTNVAIQKKSDFYDEAMGGKWELRDLKLYWMSKYGVEVVDKLFSDIKSIVLRSLMAVQPVMINDKHCFELYGYDILIDSKLKPWLLEINASPSLSANTSADYELKLQMLSSCLDVIDMEGKLRGDECRVGGFDLVYRNGYLPTHPDDSYTTMLGADIPREPKVDKAKGGPTASTSTTATTTTGGGGREEGVNKAGRSHSLANVLVGGAGGSRTRRRRSHSSVVERGKSL